MNTKIYVMAHKTFECPINDILVPFQVGAKINANLGYENDASGDNISEKNPNYCELTGLYWIWKNDYRNDVVGICHYRRYFTMNGELLSKELIESLLKSNDIIVSDKIKTGNFSVKESYEFVLNNKCDLAETRNAILRVSPEYISAYDDVMNGCEQYYGNMLICKKEIFNKYCEWLFPILFEVENHLDLSGKDAYQKRVFGFISERLLMVWIKYNQLNACEIQVSLTGEKVQVSECVNIIEDLMEKKQYDKAYEHLKRVKKEYPQFFSVVSDVDGRLGKMAKKIMLKKNEAKRLEIDKEMSKKNDKSIAIIIATNNELYLEECLFYISRLIIPEGFDLSVLEIHDGKSMTSAYNEGMNSCDSKYKLFIHQDVFLCNKNILVELINEFERNDNLGIIGVCGGDKIPQNGILYNAWNMHGIIANNSSQSFVLMDNNSELRVAEAIDGMFIATQKDIHWREELFDKWDFYDVSQSFEFRRLGYDVGVLRTNTIWAIHDCGHSSLINYYNQNNILLDEYADFLDGVSEHKGEICNKDELQIVNDVIEQGKQFFKRNSKELFDVIKETYCCVSRNSELSYLHTLYHLRYSDVDLYGRWKWGEVFECYDEAFEALVVLRFFIWRIELGIESIEILRQMLESDSISYNNLAYVISQTAIDATFFYDELGLHNPNDNRIMSFDQYQRYKTIAEIINIGYRNHCTILEIGANAQKNLGFSLVGKTIYYTDINTPDGFENDRHFFKADATNLVGVKNDSYKYVVASDVFEHIPKHLRRNFIRELYRVCEEAVIMCFPFKADYIENAEIDANSYYKRICGEDYIWLKEHIELGLPDLKQIENILMEEKMQYCLVKHGDIRVWKEMMKCHFMTVFVPGMYEERVALDKYYEEQVYKYDTSDQCYRVFLVICKSDERKAFFEKKLGELFEYNNERQLSFVEMIKESKEIGLIRNQLR